MSYEVFCCHTCKLGIAKTIEQYASLCIYRSVGIIIQIFIRPGVYFSTLCTCKVIVLQEKTLQNATTAPQQSKQRTQSSSKHRAIIFPLLMMTNHVHKALKIHSFWNIYTSIPPINNNIPLSTITLHSFFSFLSQTLSLIIST